ncbi:hypothetical protein SOPP22_10865 [Shewanella sp. OPT22]|nr:hypothetical protein SOPP22_10865 [Shewanella sp. OPT22]
MDIRPRFGTYIVSAIAGYWLAFIMLFIVATLIETEVAVSLIPVFFFSLFIAVGVSISASIFGYPIFKIIFNRLKFSFLPKLFLAGTGSCILSILTFALLFNYFIGGTISAAETFHTSLGIFSFCIVVIPFSALVYWLIER